MKQSQIDRKLCFVRQALYEKRGTLACELCGRLGVPLSLMHVVSQKRCKHMKRIDLIFDERNLFLACFGSSDTCHTIYDHGKVADLKNIPRIADVFKTLKILDEFSFLQLLTKVEIHDSKYQADIFWKLAQT